MDFVLVITCPWVMLRKTKYSVAFGIWWNNVKPIRYFRQQVDTTPLRAKNCYGFYWYGQKGRGEMIFVSFSDNKCTQQFGRPHDEAVINSVVSNDISREPYTQEIYGKVWW
jgi:hypothetical protein